MPFRIALPAILALMLWCPCADAAGTESPDRLQQARVHLQKGRYAESLEIYDELTETKANPTAIAIGRSRALEAEGQWTEATRVLQEAVEQLPHDPDLHARYAEVLIRQGRYEETEQAVDAALKFDARHPRARLVRADLLTETGRIKEAAEEYRWFVRYYNQQQPTDAETLLLVARGAAQYARWNSVSAVFRFAVNELCPDALKNDPLAWQANFISGELLLEKYNESQGLPELKSALAINPRAAEVFAAMGQASYEDLDLLEAEEYADQALTINPQLVAALRLKADLRISEGRLLEALEFVQQALAVNPHNQRTLARQAACYLLIDGSPSDDQLTDLLSHLETPDEMDVEASGRFGTLLHELARRNPRPGYFLTDLGRTMEARRHFDTAERLFSAAIAIMPQISEPKTSLGLLSMRVGKLDRARVILDAAFKADPFHVRVSNMRKVLQVLDGYDTIETEHFIVRFDAEDDRLLAEYLAEYLEEVYPRLVEQFGYEPSGKTQFEIYNEAKGLSGHQWFSARMIGLPWIQTIGATTGMIVALTSPAARDKPYNWAQVVRHEFVHVITLQQTHFNIPHWFTEALAVREEGTPRPDIWNQLLLERVPRGELSPLDKLTDGFVRPKTSLDWQFAYCQSELYADYMVETYGEHTIAALLDAYRDNRPTAEAIQQVFGVDQTAFEAGYRRYVETIVSKLRGGEPESTRTLAELEKAYEADPENPQAAAAYAQELMTLRKFDDARKLAEQALDKNPAEPLAALVMAQFEIKARNIDAAVDLLEAALDRDHPHPKVLLLLAKLKVFKEAYDEAAEHYELGRKTFPDDVDWLRGLAACRLKLDDREATREALTALAEQESDDADVPLKLARMALEDGDNERAIDYGRRALFINVREPDIHRVLGIAYQRTQQTTKALREFRVAVELDPDDEDSAQAIENIND